MNFAGEREALVFLWFMGQADCAANAELHDELQALTRELDVRSSSSSNDKEHGSDARCDDTGEVLEVDGHIQSDLRGMLCNPQPQAEELPGPADQIDPVDLQALAEDLRAVADQFERSVVMQATESLARKLSNSTINMWNAHLTLEVEWVVKHSQAPGDLHQERVMMALALTLVKGVCERTPRMLRSLFHTTLQYFGPQGL